MVFKKGEELKATERWEMNGQHIDIGDKLCRSDVGKHRRGE